MKRYWEDLPKFRFEHDAACVAEAVREYFAIELKVTPNHAALQGSGLGTGIHFVGQFIKKLHPHLTPGIPTVFQLELPSMEEDTRLLVECFIVAYARGFEDASLPRRKKS